MSRTVSLSAARDYGIVAAFIGLFITLTLSSSVFLTWTNLFNLLDQNAAIGVIAVGTTLVFIAGGFDLSVGSIYAVASVSAAVLAVHVGPAAALLLALVIGAGFGLGNGVLTSAGRLNAFIATL